MGVNVCKINCYEHNIFDKLFMIYGSCNSKGESCPQSYSVFTCNGSLLSQICQYDFCPL